MNKLLLFLFISLFAAFQLNAATGIASVSGNWSSTTTWGGSAVPTSSTAVTINDGVAVTVDVDAFCSTLTVGTSTNGACTLTINNLKTLTVSGAISVKSPSSNNNTNTLAVGSGTLVATGQTITMTGGNGVRKAQLTISTGTATVGSITIAGTTTNTALSFSGTGTLNISSTLGTGTTFTASTGTVNYNAAGAQSVQSSYAYNSLSLSGSGVKTAGGNLTVNGLLTTAVGCTLDMSTYTLTGSLTTVTNGGTIKTSSTTNPPLTSGKNWGSTGLVEYAVLTGGQFIPAGTFFNLKFDNTSGSNTAGGTLTVNNTLTTTSGGTLDMGTNTPTATTFTNGGTIKFSGASNGKAISTGTVEYYGTTQTIATGTYSTLTLSASGTKTAAGNLTATTLNNLNGSILDIVGYTLSVSGTITNTASTIRVNGSNGIAISTGTVEYYGITQTIPAGNYNNLTISTSGTKTLAGATSIAGALKINSGSTLDANSHMVTITGVGLAWNNLGSFTSGTSKVKMNGSGAQSMFSSTFNDLEIDNPAGVTLTSSNVVKDLVLTNGTLTLGANDLTVTGTISGASDSRYIITNLDLGGTLTQSVGTSPVTFPIGFVASDYTPITFSITGTPQNYNVRIRSVTPNIATTGLNRQWIVKETNANTTSLSSITLTWTATSAYTLGNPSSCDMVANITGGVDLYDPIKIGLDGTTSSVTTGSMSYPLGDITTGLYITVVGKNSLLPVELSSFTSNANGRNVNINWETKTEKNSNKFVIERTKTDAAANTLNWEFVNSVKAAVLSNSPKQYSFTDKNLQSGNYQYRLKMIDNDGSFAYSKVVEVVITLPKNFELSQNYPNPFNPTTKVNYSLPSDSRVTLEVYNIIGERVAQLVNEAQSAGYYVVNFGTSSNNISSGIYIYKLTAVDNTGKNFFSIKKMMLLK
jgi:hypothetical protein